QSVCPANFLMPLKYIPDLGSNLVFNSQCHEAGSLFYASLYLCQKEYYETDIGFVFPAGGLCRNGAIESKQGGIPESGPGSDRT
ncbi:MAG TPA: hypothetical protein PKC51_14640, partial [Ferruginibacter sp.]|nr:hypothetical protein [Ferruginibacter sp.]